MNDEDACNTKLERRLAAIVVADIVGYSRLIAENEEGTLAAMRDVRDGLTEPMVRAGGGRVVKRTGDGTLLEFGSVVDAARVAIDVQRALNERNTKSAIPLHLRIGLHLGEALVEPDGDIYGDGVNIAARLESLCAPGEILVSGAAWEQLDGKIDVPAEPLGLRELKNIPRKVALHRLAPVAGPSPVAPVSDAGKASQPLAGKPSIVVLPFDNLSRDTEQEYFCDGLVEDVITALSHFGSLFVIARNTAFTYRGRAVNVRDVGRELGVQYVLEGSVRRSGDRVRVAAQLIDATADRHVWATKYDRLLDDVFELQDELTRAIAMAVGSEVRADEMASSRTLPLKDLGAWERLARARALINRYRAPENLAAQTILEELLETHPELPQALSLLSVCRLFDALYSWNRPQADSARLAVREAARARDLAPDDEDALVILGMTLAFQRWHPESVPLFERALAINPNSSMATGCFGITLAFLHDFNRARVLLERAVRLSPRDPFVGLYFTHLGVVEWLQGRPDQAVEWCEQALHVAPGQPTVLRVLIVSNVMRGALEDARKFVTRLLEVAPDVTVESSMASVLIFHDSDRKLYRDALATAGVPMEQR